jgi:hypothetical protein
LHSYIIKQLIIIRKIFYFVHCFQKQPLQPQDCRIYLRAFIIHLVSGTLWNTLSQAVAFPSWYLSALSLSFRIDVSAHRVSAVRIPCHCAYISFFAVVLCYWVVLICHTKSFFLFCNRLHVVHVI